MADPAAFPYLSIPRQARWGAAVSGRPPRCIDPHLDSRLHIARSHKVASAGSCFAQRISEALQAGGYSYFVTEEGAPFLTPERKRELGYGVYSARYGNVYTALQLLQLLRRVFGRFEPAEPLWRLADGAFVDPFRPAVPAGGFQSEEECLLDRASHLAAVRRMFEEVEVFIFTLGLTEAWISTVDGAVLPACPGSSLGGAYDPARHAFHNFGVAEVTEHLDAFVAELRGVNPMAQIILTVSPVPLLATYEPRHVLQATVYSKSVLRVACEEAVRRHRQVHYFASYEIVTASGDSAGYFLEDRRTVSDAAVAHVIECFHRQFTGADPVVGSESVTRADPVDRAEGPAPAPAPRALAKPMCDEDLVMAALADQVPPDPAPKGRP